ncbi:MAG: hypothetical protein R3F05_00325 [Planctomycetota bacterium]
MSVRNEGALRRFTVAQVDASHRFRVGPLLPGPWTIALRENELHGGTLARVVVTDADEEVVFRMPAVGIIELHCPPARSGYSANAYVAATHEFAGRARAGVDGVLRLRLPLARRYDVTISSSGDHRTQTPLAGHVAALEPGTTREVELVPTLPLAGSIVSEGDWRWWSLAARQGAARFTLIQQGRERFFTYLPAGRYDLVSQDADGVEHVHATGIEAGREDVVLELR